MTVEIRIGDCRALLRAMPDESVDCVVTSPPYWGLRSYGTVPQVWGGDPRCEHTWTDTRHPKANGLPGPNGVQKNTSFRTVEKVAGSSCALCNAWRGELGMEPLLSQHLANLVDVFEEVRRVLRKDGTCWVNYGDCYATSPNGRSAADAKAAGEDDRTFRDKPFSTIQGSMKPKDLCMVPNRLAIALQDAGWWVRSEIIWHKPNPMPESVTDRPAGAHEKLFLLTKSQRYWYDAEAVLQPVTGTTHARVSQNVAAQIGSARANGGRKTNGNMKAVVRKQDGHSRRHAGFNERFDESARIVNSPKISEAGSGNKNNSSFIDSIALVVPERNLRNVWTIPTAAFSEAHFATFPPALVEPCIKAGCRPGGVTLDPFGGAGTVGLVADRLQREAILFELNPEYAAIAERRLHADGGMFIDVKVSTSEESGRADNHLKRKG